MTDNLQTVSQDQASLNELKAQILAIEKRELQAVPNVNAAKERFITQVTKSIGIISSFNDPQVPWKDFCLNFARRALVSSLEDRSRDVDELNCDVCACVRTALVTSDQFKSPKPLSMLHHALRLSCYEDFHKRIHRAVLDYMRDEGTEESKRHAFLSAFVIKEQQITDLQQFHVHCVKTSKSNLAWPEWARSMILRTSYEAGALLAMCAQITVMFQCYLAPKESPINDRLRLLDRNDGQVKSVQVDDLPLNNWVEDFFEQMMPSFVALAQISENEVQDYFVPQNQITLDRLSSWATSPTIMEAFKQNQPVEDASGILRPLPSQFNIVFVQLHQWYLHNEKQTSNTTAKESHLNAQKIARSLTIPYLFCRFAARYELRFIQERQALFEERAPLLLRSYKLKLKIAAAAAAAKATASLSVTTQEPSAVPSSEQDAAEVEESLVRTTSMDALTNSLADQGKDMHQEYSSNCSLLGPLTTSSACALVTDSGIKQEHAQYVVPCFEQGAVAVEEEDVPVEFDFQGVDQPLQKIKRQRLDQ